MSDTFEHIKARVRWGPELGCVRCGQKEWLLVDEGAVCSNCYEGILIKAVYRVPIPRDPCREALEDIVRRAKRIREDKAVVCAEAFYIESIAKAALSTRGETVLVDTLARIDGHGGAFPGKHIRVDIPMNGPTIGDTVRVIVRTA